MRRIATLLLGLAAVAAGSSEAQLMRLRARALVHDGLIREYLLYTPRMARRLPGERPLLLVLHGGGGSHRGIVQNTRRKFHQLADRHGFYVVYPNAVDKMWDFGEAEISEAQKRRVDDLGFFSRLLDRLLANHPIDPGRVFAIGISRGGQASYFLACKMGERIRAIAPIAMPLPAFLEDDCRRGPPVGMAIFNGTEDPVVPYDGGGITLFRQQRGRVLSTDATVRLWRARNGCSDESESQTIDEADDATRVIRTAWNDCAAAAAVVLYRIEGGGHTWPSGGRYLPQTVVGRATREIDAAIEAWSFFATFAAAGGPGR
jgi:polyhydroxybutyrate depolymerase